MQQDNIILSINAHYKECLYFNVNLITFISLNETSITHPKLFNHVTLCMHSCLLCFGNGEK